MSHAHLQEYNPNKYGFTPNKKKKKSRLFPQIDKNNNSTQQMQSSILITVHDDQ